MAKPALPRLAPLAAAVLALMAEPARADWDVKPAVQLRETYTDNVALAAEPLAQSQLVSEVTPELAIIHTGPRLELTSSFKLYHYEYSHAPVHDVASSQREAKLNAHAKLVRDLLFLDAEGSTGQRAISPFGQLGSAENYLTANRATVTTYRFSPYMVKRFGSTANLQLRFTRDGVASSTAGLENTRGNTLQASLDSGTAFRKLGWGLQASRQEMAISNAPTITTENLLASLRYRLVPTFALSASGGYDKYDYTSVGGVTAGNSWTGGFIWDPSPRTHVDASVGKRFIGNTKSFKGTHRSRLTVWDISYGDSITNTRSNFLLPATLDTTSLLDRMFQANIADPALRREAVADYIARTGLPPTLSDSVNYFSNRFFLQKQLNASLALRGAHSTLIISAYRSHRNALSTATSDSTLLGSSNSSINDNVLQRGGRLAFNYTLSSHSDVSLTHDVFSNHALTIGLDTNNRATRLQLNRRISRNLVTAFELRRVSGTSLATNHQPFRENAIAASLTFQR